LQHVETSKFNLERYLITIKLVENIKDMILLYKVYTLVRYLYGLNAKHNMRNSFCFNNNGLHLLKLQFRLRDDYNITSLSQLRRLVMLFQR